MARSPVPVRAFAGYAAALAITVWACSDESPTASGPSSEVDGSVDAPEQTSGGEGIFSERVHALSDEGFELASSTTEITAGLYRFHPTGTEPIPEVRRDEFIVTRETGGSAVVRRVLASSVSSGDLLLETGPAYWHEVVRSGTYTVTMPLGGPDGALLVGPQGAPVYLGRDSLDLPPVEVSFHDADACQLLHDVLDRIPGATERRVCGKEVEMSIAYGVGVTIHGTIDSLRILEGNARLTGDMDISVTVDGGSITGGRAPVFAPCNRAAYLGCLSTPTGANLIDFIRRYAPVVPEASLPPVRVCIPGTPVRTRRGYWSGFTYTPAVWEDCRVLDAGQLPTVVLPSVQATANEVRPHLVGDLTIRVVGDGTFEIEIPIVGSKQGYSVTNDLKAEAELGLFITLGATLKNAGATVRLTFDDTGRLAQAWSDQAGWDQDFDLVEKSNHAELLDLTNPDSTVLRFGVPIKVKAEVCIAIYACGKTEEEGGDPETELELDIFGKKLIGGTGFNLGAEAGVGVSFFKDAIVTREQIHPDDPDVDNWHISMEAGYTAFGSAGVHIPLTGWIAPNVPREVEKEWECCRVSTADYWGQGKLEVITSTTGVNVDPDGYKVLVERADTLPVVMDAGVQRVGNGWPRFAFERSIDPDGSITFGEVASFLPCIAVYSDGFVIGNPVWGLPTAGARATGVNVPNFGVTSACRWLIARYKVTLSDVAANCVVADGAVRDSVWLQQRRYTDPVRDDLQKVYFNVECGVAGAQGGIEVVLDPIGRLPDAPPLLYLDGNVAAVFVTDTVTLGGFAPGEYEIVVEGLDPLCETFPASDLVTVVGGQVTSVSPLVLCDPVTPSPGTVTYSATMSGDAPDENGYVLLVDGAPRAHLPVDRSGAVDGLAASTPTVFMVSDIAGNCQPQAPNPSVITLNAAADPIDVPFEVHCTTQRPDTLIGTLDASGWPVTTVTLRASDGTTLLVSGPKASELARMTGAPVRVWGTTSATGIDVHGYDLRSRLGDDRWMGIVLNRTDGLWLFGDEAVLLVDAPAGLASQSGRLVWVVGREESGGVRPTLYGVIR